MSKEKIYQWIESGINFDIAVEFCLAITTSPDDSFVIRCWSAAQQVGILLLLACQ